LNQENPAEAKKEEGEEEIDEKSIKKEISKLKDLLTSKRIELKLYTNLLEKKKKEIHTRPLGKLLRMKRNLEFRISVEARTKDDEKKFINEIQKIEEEIKKARELKKIEKKIMLLGQDIEQTLAKIRELNKKIKKPKPKANKEITLEDIATIKKKES
jgi:hypothetical protein